MGMKLEVKVHVLTRPPAAISQKAMKPTKPSGAWDDRFWKEKIPRYNAILDKHCKSYRHTYFRPRTVSADSQKPPLGPSKSSALHESVLAQILREIEEVWRQQRIPDEFRRTYRTAFAKMQNQDVANFVSREISLLREGNSVVQRAIAAIQQREDTVACVKKIVSRLSLVQVETLQSRLFESLLRLRTASLHAAELLFALSDQLRGVSRDSRFFPAAIVFSWNGRNYIKKMTTDLNFLQRSSICRLMNVGSSADPMLLSPALRPPDNREFCIYKGAEPQIPLLEDGLMVIPVAVKDIDRLLHAAKRLTSDLPQLIPTPPSRSQNSIYSSRGGGTADSSKPILPLRLKVLIQRFQSAPTDDDSLCVRTRAMSELDNFDDGEVGHEVAESFVDTAVQRVLAALVVEEVAAEALWEEILTLEISQLATEQMQQKREIVLPDLSEETPLAPSLSPVTHFEDELPSLLPVYYAHLPASVLNISEKPVVLSSLMLAATQPSWLWLTDRSRVCGLVGVYISEEGTVVAHLSTLREEWFEVGLKSLAEHFCHSALVVPLHAWNGAERDLEKFAVALRNNGFEALEKPGRWSGYKAVYILRLRQTEDQKSDLQLRIASEVDTSSLLTVSPFLSVLKVHDESKRLELDLDLQSYEVRPFAGSTYIRLKTLSSSPLLQRTLPNGLKVLIASDRTKDFALLFISGSAVPPEPPPITFLLDELGEDIRNGSEEIEEAWAPTFQVLDGIELCIGFMQSAPDVRLLPLRCEPVSCITSPFLFAVVQMTIWKTSHTPLCIALIISPKTGS